MTRKFSVTIGWPTGMTAMTEHGKDVLAQDGVKAVEIVLAKPLKHLGLGFFEDEKELKRSIRETNRAIVFEKSTGETEVLELIGGKVLGTLHKTKL
jgi:hypothetical protein